MLPISITPNAKQKLKTALQMHPELGYVRIGIKGGGGCGGIIHSLGLDNATDKDQKYENEEIPFIINKGHLMHLVGLEIDYIEDGEDKGFVFRQDSKD